MQCWKQAVITNCSRSHPFWSRDWPEKCKNHLLSLSHCKPPSSFCRCEASCLNTAFKERPKGHFYVLLANFLPAHWRQGMRKEKDEQRGVRGIHHQQGQLTNPSSNFSEAVAYVATCCEHVEQENLDAQDGWRHPVPALLTHVLVPLEKSTIRLSCLSYKICLHNVQLHPTHAIPHPQHLDHRNKRHLKRFPTECLFWRRCLEFGKTDRKKLLHMQCMFLSHFKHVLMPIMQPEFFTSG